MKEYQFSARLIESGCPEDLAGHEIDFLNIGRQPLTAERLERVIRSQQMVVSVARYCGFKS